MQEFAYFYRFSLKRDVLVRFPNLFGKRCKPFSPFKPTNIHSNKTHDFVDWVAKVAEAKGISFRFTNTEGLKEMGITVEGKTVNGALTKDGVVINIQSQKALNAVVGHEIGEVIRKAKGYGALQKTLISVARERGEYESRLLDVQKRYKSIKNADVLKELTNDLLGDYLFTDYNFIKGLVDNNKGIARKIYDEIKYLFKMATPGSTEQKQMAKAKRMFEKAFSEKSKVDTDGVEYGLSENARADVDRALSDLNYTEDVYLTDSSPSIIASQSGVRNLPMLMKASHIRENVFTEQEAKELGIKVDKYTNYHGLGKTLFLDIIDGLDDVTLAYRGTRNADNPSRRENYFLLISQYKDQSGNTVNVPVYIDEKGQYNRVFIDTNKVATVFGRDNFSDYIRRELQNGNLVRIKNKSTQASELAAPIADSYSESALSNLTVPQADTESQDHSMQNGENYSLSDGDTTPTGDYQVTTEDVMRSDLGPVAQDVAQEQVDMGDIPIRSDLGPVGQDVAQNNVDMGDIPIRSDLGPVRSDVQSGTEADLGPVRSDIAPGNAMTDEAAAEENIKKVFGIKNINDYVGVQKAVVSTLENNGFFSNENNIITNAESGMRVEITKRGIRETLGNGNRFQTLPRTLKGLKLMSIPNLPAIIQKANLISDDQANYHSDTSGVKYAYLSTDVTLDYGGKSKEYTVNVVVRKSQQKNMFWMHEVQITEKEHGLSPSGDEMSAARVNKTHALEESVSQAGENVKSLTILAPTAEDIAEMERQRQEQSLLETSTPKGIYEAARLASIDSLLDDETQEQKIDKVKKATKDTKEPGGKPQSVWSKAAEVLVDDGIVWERLDRKNNSRRLQAMWQATRNSNKIAQNYIGNAHDGVRSLVDVLTDVERAGKTTKKSLLTKVSRDFHIVITLAGHQAASN